MAKRRKKKGKKKIVFIVLLLLILLGGGAYYYLSTHKEVKEQIEKKITKKLKIVDEDSKTRPIAVMINNDHEAWPHARLQNAYITYEIMAEGGITRLMAIYRKIKILLKLVQSVARDHIILTML